MSEVISSGDVAHRNKIRQAFALALQQYQPWHTPKWNSTNNDAFSQIISGAILTGVSSVASIAERFNVPEQEVENWEKGREIPMRKTRIKVWKALRQDAGLVSPS